MHRLHPPLITLQMKISLDSLGCLKKLLAHADFVAMKLPSKKDHLSLSRLMIPHNILNSDTAIFYLCSFEIDLLFHFLCWSCWKFERYPYWILMTRDNSVFICNCLLFQSRTVQPERSYCNGIIHISLLA